MNRCDFCGEYKPVKEIKGYNHFYKYTSWRIFFDIPYSYDLICKECYLAHELVYEQIVEKRNKLRMEQRNKWIKQRDKILKENNIK